MTNHICALAVLAETRAVPKSIGSLPDNDARDDEPSGTDPDSYLG